MTQRKRKIWESEGWVEKADIFDLKESIRQSFFKTKIGLERHFRGYERIKPCNLIVTIKER